MHSSICIALDLFDDRSYHNRINKYYSTQTWVKYHRPI